METRRIVCRQKDLNARGNGVQEVRRVRLPDGNTGWASELAQDLKGGWSNGAFLASERKCAQWGEFPVGTLVLAFESQFRHGSKIGTATIAGGVVDDGVDGREPIRWGLSTRRRGQDVQIQAPDGAWLDI